MGAGEVKRKKWPPYMNGYDREAVIVAKYAYIAAGLTAVVAA